MSSSSGHILGLYYVRLLNTAPFCENYTKFYFDAKHSENGLNKGGGVKLLKLFFKNSALFHKNVSFLASIEHCPKFLEYTLIINIGICMWNPIVVRWLGENGCI